ncbi:MAG: hypothetical protein ACXABZ_13185 [Candidatus Thorarchaeota archaeon]|jgi:Leucine-rich repeat (LRR) protein
MKTPRGGKGRKPSPLVTLDDGNIIEMQDVLTQYPEVKTAYIQGLDIEEIDLSQIALPSLRSLTIEETSLTAIDLEPLSACDWLGFLKINHNQSLKRVNLSPLGACKILSDLQLRDNLFDDLDFRQLGNCKKLLKLDLANNPSRRLRLNGIDKIEKLSRLSIGPQDNYGPEDWTIDLTPLFECQTLKRLYLPEFCVKVLINRRYREAYEIEFY